MHCWWITRFECLSKRFTRSLFATEAKVNLELAYSYISSFWKETSFVSNSFCCNFWRVYRRPPGPGTHRFYRWLYCLVSNVVFYEHLSALALLLFILWKLIHLLSFVCTRIRNLLYCILCYCNRGILAQHGLKNSRFYWILLESIYI